MRNVPIVTEKVFSFPKPVGLIRHIIEMAASDKSAIVLDFFAGSGTTAHAVMAQNAFDSGCRRYIVAQLPEPVDPANKDQKTAADFCDKLGKPRTIAELTKERLRRAAAKVKADNPLFAGDTGFRVFKLDHSNIRAWNPNPADLEASLFDHQDHLLEGRSEADVLYELLLKLGLDLCVPIEKKDIAGKAVHSIGGGALIVGEQGVQGGGAASGRGAQLLAGNPVQVAHPHFARAGRLAYGAGGLCWHGQARRIGRRGQRGGAEQGFHHGHGVARSGALVVVLAGGVFMAVAPVADAFDHQPIHLGWAADGF